LALAFPVSVATSQGDLGEETAKFSPLALQQLQGPDADLAPDAIPADEETIVRIRLVEAEPPVAEEAKLLCAKAAVVEVKRHSTVLGLEQRTLVQEGLPALQAPARDP
jgi:hypothetical protein